MKLADNEFAERDLIERVMRNLQGPAGNTYGRQRWAIVTGVFAIGSTCARALCREFGLDPDEHLKHPDIVDDEDDEEQDE